MIEKRLKSLKNDQKTLKMSKYRSNKMNFNQELRLLNL